MHAISSGHFGLKGGHSDINDGTRHPQSATRLLPAALEDYVHDSHTTLR